MVFLFLMNIFFFLNQQPFSSAFEVTLATCTASKQCCRDWNTTNIFHSDAVHIHIWRTAHSHRISNSTALRFISHTNDFFVFVTETIRQNNSIYLIHFYKPSTFFFSSSSCIDARVWRLKYVFFFSSFVVAATVVVTAVARLLSWIFCQKKKRRKIPCDFFHAHEQPNEIDEKKK